MMRGLLSGTAVLLALTLASAQTGRTPSFDAASVKPAALPTPNGRGMILISPPSGGPGTKEPGCIRYPLATMMYLLTTAYDVKPLQISGPPWLESEHYAITATMPPDTTKEQFRLMLQNLLAERFQLAIHRETKELPEYVLVTAKNGSKLRASADSPAAAENDAPPPPPPSRPKIGADGFPDLPPGITSRPGIFNIMMPGRARLIASRQTMEDLANRLTTQLNRPVIDSTGLQGKYDFTLTYSTEGLPGRVGMALPPPPPGGAAGPGGSVNVFVPDGEAPPDLFAALQSQLGLKLESKKGPVEIIVVDRVERVPTEN